MVDLRDNIDGRFSIIRSSSVLWQMDLGKDSLNRDYSVLNDMYIKYSLERIVADKDLKVLRGSIGTNTQLLNNKRLKTLLNVQNDLDIHLDSFINRLKVRKLL